MGDRNSWLGNSTIGFPIRRWGADVNKNEKYPVETYSRVVGYLSPVSHWNKGKKELKNIFY